MEKFSIFERSLIMKVRKSLAKYFEDWVATQKVCGDFYKNHWKGQLLMSTAAGLGAYGAIKIVTKIREKNM